MEKLSVQPKNKAEAAMLKSILKALKVSFKSESISDTEKPYNPAFVEENKRSSQHAKEGKVTRIAIEDLWK